MGSWGSHIYESDYALSWLHNVARLLALQVERNLLVLRASDRAIVCLDILVRFAAEHEEGKVAHSRVERWKRTYLSWFDQQAEGMFDSRDEISHFRSLRVELFDTLREHSYDEEDIDDIEQWIEEESTVIAGRFFG